MVLWKQEAKGRLRIVSESFGSDTYIAADKVPYAGRRVEETNRISKNEVLMLFMPRWKHSIPKW
jgi:hypothetical protein